MTGSCSGKFILHRNQVSNVTMSESGLYHRRVDVPAFLHVAGIYCDEAIRRRV